MSRRKQSNPRQIKRSLGDMEETEDQLALESNQSERDGSASDPEESAESSDRSPSPSAEAEGEQQPPDDVMSPSLESDRLLPRASPSAASSDAETPETEDSVNYKEAESPASDEDPSEPSLWNGPDDLGPEISAPSGGRRVRALTHLTKGHTWGPYTGTFNLDRTQGGALSLEVEEDCWLRDLTPVPCELDANSVLYRKGDQVWCKTSKDMERGEEVRAFLMAEPQAIPNVTVKEEPGESSHDTPAQPEFQLLPQQAGMAAILATAIVNKDIFPCKDCGIWYRSERNLQAHLMYYCASRQSSGSPATEEKPKDSYPNERICPFPQCKKSCPSASSLEIHMRSHSGERPFICLICLSAFTTKANCERHLKVHTDTLNGVCHGCGFISTTRDILYSHLVTNHMICQPGSKVDVYPVVKTIPGAKLTNSAANQMSSSGLLKCSLCGFLADCLATLQQHVIIHTSTSVTSPVSASVTSPASASVTSPTSKSPSDAENEPHELQRNGDPKSPLCSSNSAPEAPPIKVHIKEEPDAPRPIEANDEPAPVPSPAVKVKTEISSPTPGSSPVPNESGASVGGGAVLLPQYVFGHEAAPAMVPQASEILAKMSELVHSRLKQGQPVAAVGFSGTPKGATCFECEITFNNINNYYVHKRLYCSGRHLSEESASGERKLKAAPGRATADNRGTSPRQEESGGGEAANPIVQIKAEEGAGAENETVGGGGGGHVSEGSQSPGGPSDDADEDPTRTACEACNIRFSRHETYMVHKKYYCASRHDPPLRRGGGAATAKPGPPYTPQPLPRTRKRRKLYEIHGVSPAEVASPALFPLNRVESLPIMPGLIPAPAVPSPSSSPDAADGPIDLSKKPRLLVETPLPTAPAAAAIVPLTDYHECTACRISFHSLETYLAHKKFSCPVAPLQQKALQQLQKINPALKMAEEGARVKIERRTSPDSLPDSEASPSTAACPYCPTNVVVRGDLLEHFRSVHGLVLAGHRLPTPFLEVLVPARARANSAPSPPASSNSPPQGQQKDVKEGATSSSSSSSSGSPLSSAAVRAPVSSSPALAPDLRREDGLKVSAQALLPGDKAAQPPKSGLASTPLPNGNHRYCRLCNIKFSSLSTFIAHKKYYCSSHAAEHVK